MSFSAEAGKRITPGCISMRPDQSANQLARLARDPPTTCLNSRRLLQCGFKYEPISNFNCDRRGMFVFKRMQPGTEGGPNG